MRIFELELLQEIGYALNLEEDAIAHEPLESGRLYEFRADEGPVAAISEGAEVPLYTGAELVSIARKDFSDPQTLRKAKQLLRSVLDYYIGGRGLHTRRIAAAMKR